MKRQIAVIGLAMALGASVAPSDERAMYPVAAAGAESEQELEYLELVMNIFRHHLEALELLIASDTKYGDNVVRHAAAIQHTSGLLDHIYAGPAPGDDREWPWKSEEEFWERVEANRKAAQRLSRVASAWLEDRDRERLVQAIESLKVTCRNCHGNLRDWP